jgi:hypothetical protein
VLAVHAGRRSARDRGRIESILGGLDRRLTSQKAAWFDAYRRVVTTTDGVAWLTSVWRRDVKIQACRWRKTAGRRRRGTGPARCAPAAALLQKQLARFRNDDRRARLRLFHQRSTTGMCDAFFET